LVAAAGGYVYWRVHRFDGLIREVAAQYELDPELVRAVVWQESRFNPLAVGSRGEIGLMQVTREAAVEWAAAQGRTTPELAELFVPTVNLHVGTWYLARALAYWAQYQENPLPYALAEYNAGRRNVSRWAEGTSATNFHQRIGYPSTRRYVTAVLERYGRSMPSKAQ
jgi:soluble lytic murein transglycosylase